MSPGEYAPLPVIQSTNISIMALDETYEVVIGKNSSHPISAPRANEIGVIIQGGFVHLRGLTFQYFGTNAVVITGRLASALIENCTFVDLIPTVDYQPDRTFVHFGGNVAGMAIYSEGNLTVLRSSFLNMQSPFASYQGLAIAVFAPECQSNVWLEISDSYFGASLSDDVLEVCFMLTSEFSFSTCRDSSYKQFEWRWPCGLLSESSRMPSSSCDGCAAFRDHSEVCLQIHVLY